MLKLQELFVIPSGSAKPLYVGSNPTRASKLFNNNGLSSTREAQNYCCSNFEADSKRTVKFNCFNSDSAVTACDRPLRCRPFPKHDLLWSESLRSVPRVPRCDRSAIASPTTKNRGGTYSCYTSCSDWSAGRDKFRGCLRPARVQSHGSTIHDAAPAHQNRCQPCLGNGSSSQDALPAHS